MSFRSFVDQFTHDSPAHYNLRTEGDHFLVVKYDDNFDVAETYHLREDGTLCDCPSGHRPTCRHRKMFLTLRERVDTGWCYCYDMGVWSDPFQSEASEANTEAVEIAATPPTPSTPSNPRVVRRVV